MVVKPMAFVVRGHRGLIQPALKVRGYDYLRIIYGPEYAEPQNRERLRRLSLGAKRSLTLLEFALRSRRSSASCAKSHFAGCTSAASAFLHSRASPSTHGSEECVLGYAVIKWNVFLVVIRSVRGISR
jgi:hypothetical protein